MEIYSVKINGLKNPMGYLYDTLLCSWKVREATGKKQKNAVIKVATDANLQQIVYEIENPKLDSLGTKLDMKLEPYTRYYYQVSVTTDVNETATSEICWFETAKLEEPWSASWIGITENDSIHPEFRKLFNVSNKVKQARLYICGLGLFEAYVNGKKVGNDVLAPFINDYAEHIQYCTYDVTDMLSEENELLVWLGKGWYMGRFGLTDAAYGKDEYALIAELHLVYEDGRKEVIGTDTSWKYRGNIVRDSSIYDGEEQDYLYWEDKENPWRSARRMEAPAKLVERYSPGLFEMETLPVKEVIHTPAGETVLDFGQNFAGMFECTQSIPKGEKMKLEFAEILQNGNFYHENYRTAKSEFTYVSDGCDRVIRPFFTFFGFRYIKISGLDEINLDCFKGKAVYSDMDRIGKIETGNSKIDRLHENTVWGLKSNFIDMPTDCPQRDERLGWTGDAQVFCPTAGYLMDTRGFYAKFMRDLRSDQLRNDGKGAIYLPNEFPGLFAGVWSDILTFLPNMYYDYYGSKEMLACHYPMMRDWVDCVRREDQKRGEQYLWDFGFQFGDWLALDGATEQSTFGATDSGYVASAYYYASASYVAKAARILGYEEATKYEKLSEDIRKAMLAEYFTPNGRLAIDTQTGYLIALKFGIYQDKEKVITALRARIKKDCYRIKGGFVGATMMNTVLADNGMEDLAYDFLFFEGFPGWLYAVNLGATTIWERWNSVLADGSMSGTGMNSLNHYSYGSVMEFLYRHAMGIAPIEPGFRKVRLAPKPDIRLGYLNGSYASAAGRYVSQWKIKGDGRLVFHFEIPFGCEAEVMLPEQEVMYLTSGSYDFEIETKRNYLALYNGDTPLERLLDDERAVAILNNYIPGFVDSINRNDLEEMTKSLNDKRNRALLFRQPTEAFGKAICALEGIKWGVEK